MPPAFTKILDDNIHNRTSLPSSSSSTHTVKEHQPQIPTATLAPCRSPVDTPEPISTSSSTTSSPSSSSPNNTLDLHEPSPNTSAPISFTDTTTTALPTSSVHQHPQAHLSSAPELVYRSTGVCDSTSCLGINSAGLGHLPEVGLTHQVIVYRSCTHNFVIGTSDLSLLHVACLCGFTPCLLCSWYNSPACWMVTRHFCFLTLLLEGCITQAQTGWTKSLSIGVWNWVSRRWCDLQNSMFVLSFVKWHIFFYWYQEKTLCWAYLPKNCVCCWVKIFLSYSWVLSGNRLQQERIAY